MTIAPVKLLFSEGETKSTHLESRETENIYENNNLLTVGACEIFWEELLEQPFPMFII